MKKLMEGTPKQAVRIYFRWPHAGRIERYETHTWTVPYINENGRWDIRKESHPEWDHLPDRWPWPVQPGDEVQL